MNISFKSKKLKKQLTDPSEIMKTYGAMAKKVNQRMKELKAVENIDDLYKIPAANCHLLKGDLKNMFAVSISGNHRIIFTPNHDPMPLKKDYGINCIEITDITIIKAKEDYH